MLAHLTAIKALLQPLYPTHLFRVTGAKPQQYLVLSAPGWGAPDELSVAGAAGELDVDVRVKAAAVTTDGVLIMLNRVRALLSPALRPARLVVADRSAWIQYVRSEFVDIDPDETITGLNVHPAFGVDTYHLTSEPRS